MPHYVKCGDELVEERRYSDTLLIALLEAYRPGRFRDDGMEEKLTDEELRMWTPQQREAYRGGASIEEVRNIGYQLRLEAAKQVEVEITVPPAGEGSKEAGSAVRSAGRLEPPPGRGVQSLVRPHTSDHFAPVGELPG